MNPQPKTKNIVDYKYRAWIEQQPCCVCGNTQTVVAAHQRMGSDGGTGLKPSDTYAVPLCHKCHMEQHRVGESTFWFKAFFDDSSIDRYKIMVDLVTRYRKETA